MVVTLISSMCPAATSGRDYGMQICIVPFQGHKTVGTQPGVGIKLHNFCIRYEPSAAKTPA
jgi:hypothetical protein